MQADDLRLVGTVLRKLNAPLLVHAESPFVIEQASQCDEVALGDGRSYHVYLQSRPPEAELEAIKFLIDYVRTHGCRVHIVHLAAPEALEEISGARAEGLPITVETCPHYLTFAAEDIPDGATTFKCAPPIRDGARRELLWEALRNGSLDMVVSDHSPCPPVMKQLDSGDFLAAWGGIASLQVTLAAVWTGAHQRGCDLNDVVRWMCAAPAELAGLESRKGRIAAGYQADLTVFDPAAVFTVDATTLEHRHKITPYDGMTLRGVVHAAYLRGVAIYENGKFGAPSGRLLRRME
jgi:allantoinase